MASPTVSAIPTRHSSNTAGKVGIGVGIAAGVALLAGILFWHRRRGKRREKRREKSNDTAEKLEHGPPPELHGDSRHQLHSESKPAELEGD